MSSEKKPDGKAREGWVRYSLKEKIRRNIWTLFLVGGVGLVFFVLVLDMPFVGATLLVGAIFAVTFFIRSRYSAQWFCPEGHEVFQGQSYCTKCGRQVPRDESPTWQDETGGSGE